MSRMARHALLSACLFSSSAALGLAAETFTLSSPDFQDQDMLPLSSKCRRHGGQGLSPALEWSSVPEGTKSFVLLMHHYPRGSVAGRDTPSHYWSLWNIPSDIHSLSPGNTESLGNEGADKDSRGLGYTPPCSPGNARHAYTITLYALDAAPTTLGSKDDPSVDWSTVMQAIEGNIIASSALTFFN